MERLWFHPATISLNLKPKVKAMAKRYFLSILGIIVITLVITACKSSGMNLSLEIIEKNTGAFNLVYYQASNPAIMVVTNTEDVTKLDGLVTSKAFALLQRIDYQKYFTLIVFQGAKPSTGYEVQITRVTREGNTVNVFVNFHEPALNETEQAVGTSKRCLAKIKKIGTWGQEITFQVVIDGKVVVSTSSYIP